MQTVRKEQVRYYVTERGAAESATKVRRDFIANTTKVLAAESATNQIDRGTSVKD